MGLSNFNKLDYFLPMALVKEENALTDLVGGVKAIPSSSPLKVFEGYSFNGTNNYIDGNLNIKEAKNYITEDAQMEAFIYDGEPTQSNKQVFGAEDTSRVYLSYQNAPRTLITVHDGGFLIVNSFPLKQLYSIAREGVNKIAYRRGINVGSNTDAVTDIPNQTMGIGAMMKNGAGTNHWQGVLSIASFGANIGVNQVAKSDHYIQFLEDLGLTL